MNSILQDTCNLKKYYPEPGNDEINRKSLNTSDKAVVDKIKFGWFYKVRSHYASVSGA